MFIFLITFSEPVIVTDVKDITYEPTEVVIAGNMEKLDAMDSFDITLPVKIDISDDNNTKLTKVIPLRDYF